VAGGLRARYLELLATPLPAMPRAPVVVVIDGLDEADGWKPTAELFPPLPSGIGVVFSAREVAGRDWLAEVGLREATVQHLRLHTLTREEIAQIVGAAADGVPAWAREPESLAEIHRISGGDPLYVRYLVDDLLPDADGTVRIGSLEELERQPSGLARYFDNWWAELDQARRVSPDLGSVVRDLLSYLLVSKGPLSRDDLSYVSDDDAIDDWVVDEALAAVGRHIRGDQDAAYELAHHRFQAYLAERRLKEPTLVPYRARLLAYCARWHEHESRYALRHYADHVADAGGVEELLALARDAAFAAAQRRLCPDDPRLPAHASSLAFIVAARRDDAAGMAEAALRKAAALGAVRSGFSPLAAVRDVGLDAAWSLADLHDPQRRALWNLLLAWELHAAGRDDAAAATLERLLAGELVELEEDVWLPLFRPARVVAAALAAELETRLLGAPLRAVAAADSARMHARSGDWDAARDTFAAAIAVVEAMADPSERAVVRTMVAKAQFDAGDDDGARASYVAAAEEIEPADGWFESLFVFALLEQLAEAGHAAAALEAVRRLELDESDDALAEAELELGYLVHAQAGDVGHAIAAALRLEKPVDRVEALSRVGTVLADARDGAGALKAFAAAAEVARSLDDEPARAKLLATVAAGQASAGDLAAAHGSYETAVAALQMGETEDSNPDALAALAGALGAIGLAQAEAGDPDAARQSHLAARETALAAAEAKPRAWALAAVAHAQTRAGDPAGARLTSAAAIEAAEVMTARGDAVAVLTELAAAQAKAGDAGASREIYRAAVTLAQRLEAAERTRVLATVAVAEAETDEAAARETYAAAIWDAPVAIPSDAWRTDALASLAEAQARVADSGARHTALSIEDDAKRDAALVGVANAQAKSGDVAAALATVSEIADASLRADSLVVIAGAQVRAGDAAGAARLANGIDDAAVRAAVLVGVAQAQAAVGDSAGARETAARAYDSAQASRKPRVIGAVAAELVRVGDLDTSRAAARLMIEEATAKKDRKGFGGWVLSLFSPDAGAWLKALSEFATAQAAAGDAAGARETFRVASEILDELESDSTRRSAWTALAAARARSGEAEAVRALALEADDAWQRAEAFAAVADAQARAGDAAAAHATVALIDDASARAGALAVLAGTLAGAGDPDAARDAALALHEGARWPPLAAVAEAYARAGNADAARRWFAEARRDAQTGGAPEDERWAGLADVAGREVRAGLASDAMRVLDAAFVHPKVLEALAAALAESGETALLKDVVETCAEYEELGAVVCEALARAYPAQVPQIAERVVPLLTSDSRRGASALSASV
jgi:hypothetical protein